MEDGTDKKEHMAGDHAFTNGMEPTGKHVSHNPQDTGGPVMTSLSKGLVALVVAVSLMTSAFSVAVYDMFIAQKVVTVNMRKYIDEQRDLYLTGKVSKEQLAQNLDDLIASLKSAPKNRIIILEDVVANSSEKFDPKR